MDYNVKAVPVDGLLNSFKESVTILLDNPELADETLIKIKLKEFVLLMTKTQNAPTQLDFLASMFKKNTSEFKETILKNLYSNLTIDEFAHLCGMSLSTFKRKFTETFKESPKKYIAIKKLEKATMLLAYQTIESLMLPMIVVSNPSLPSIDLSRHISENRLPNTV